MEFHIIIMKMTLLIQNYLDSIGMVHPIASGSSQPISTNTPNAKENVDGTIELKIKGHSTSGSLNTFHSIEVHINEPNSNKIGNTISWSGNGTRTISASIPGQDLNRAWKYIFH